MAARPPRRLGALFEEGDHLEANQLGGFEVHQDLGELTRVRTLVHLGVSRAYARLHATSIGSSMSLAITSPPAGTSSGP